MFHFQDFDSQPTIRVMFGHTTYNQLDLAILLWQEYFEALEVLNQHEYLARVTTLESQESLAERVDGIPDSPEEGDYTGDTDILSEAEGEDFEQPRTRSACFLKISFPSPLSCVSEPSISALLYLKGIPPQFLPSLFITRSLLWSMCTFSIEPWAINVRNEDWVFSLNLMSKG